MTITYSKWMGIPHPTKVKIAQQFGIAKVRSISVVDNVVVDDGFNIRDVEIALNVGAMQDFLNVAEKDPNTLLDLVAQKMEGVVEEVRQPIIPPIIEKVKPVDKTEGLVPKIIKAKVTKTVTKKKK